MEMMFGMIRPTNGMLPTVTTMSDVVNATIDSPSSMMRWGFSPRLIARVSPMPAMVKRLAYNHEMATQGSPR